MGILTMLRGRKKRSKVTPQQPTARVRTTTRTKSAPAPSAKPAPPAPARSASPKTGAPTAHQVKIEALLVDVVKADRQIIALLRPISAEARQRAAAAADAEDLLRIMHAKGCSEDMARAIRGTRVP